MINSIISKDIEELYRTSIVQQTAFWSRVKNQLGLTTLAIDFKARNDGLYQEIGVDTTVNSDLLLIIQRINRYDSIAYIPYGPELEPDAEFQGVFLEELSESLRSFLPAGCINIRYDLYWESYWAGESGDTAGGWYQEPDPHSQEFRFNYPTQNWNFRKAFSNILPTHTIYLKLNADPEAILMRMKPKTRYNIHLAKRKGVVVRSAGLESIGIWYQLYRETARRNHLLENDLKYFEAILTARADASRSPAEVRLLIAEVDHKPLAALFLIITGNRGSYLYGASSDNHRNFMATYALQWEAIRLSREHGCLEYDMFGISPNPDTTHPLFGLYKFKSGFGGEIYRSLGCWDYPLDVVQYNSFRNFEMRSKGYHTN